MAAGDWAELIRDSLIEIGVKEAGEALDTDETQDSLRRLRGMLDEFALEGLIVPGFTRRSLTVTVAQSVYTVGPEGSLADDADPDIVAATPIEQIYALNYRRAGQQDSWPMDQTSYPTLSATRTLYTNNPTQFFYDRAHPVARLLFDALTTPDDVFQLVYRGHFADIEAADQTSDILPRGYREGVMLNLAVKLAPSFGVKEGRSAGLSKTTKDGAKDAIDLWAKRNIGVVEARIDPALRTQRTSQLCPSRYSY